jgi:hypothetical protein
MGEHLNKLENQYFSCLSLIKPFDNAQEFYLNHRNF